MMRSTKTNFVKLFSVVLLVFLVGYLSFTFNTSKNTTMYNTSPDVDSKIVGSEKSLDYVLPLKSVDEILEFSDLVVLGNVVTEGETKEMPLSMPSDLRKKYDEKFPGKEPTYSVAQVQFKIEKVLYGTASSNEITLVQLGKAGNDDLETKVKKGDKMVMILRKCGDNIYSSSAAEDGLFKVDTKGKVMSMSKNLAVAKYDNIGLSILEADIQKAVK